MDDAALIRHLEALEPPEVDASCERAKRALRAQPEESRAGLTPSRPRRHLTGARLGFAVALVALCVTLAAAALFSAPGQAITSWVGNQLGFGGVGEQPTLRQLRTFASAGTAAQGQPAYVLVRGPAPDGKHYEFITYRAKDEPGKLWPAGARCFELDFPEARNLANAGCGLPAAGSGLLFEGVGGNSQPGAEYHYASGRVSDDVDSVEVEFDGRPAAVELTPIPADLVARFQIRRPFKFFIAFIDHARHGGTVTVTTRDAAGQALARRTSIQPDFSIFQRR
jgi:hypothetical protein